MLKEGILVSGFEGGKDSVFSFSSSRCQERFYQFGSVHPTEFCSSEAYRFSSSRALVEGICKPAFTSLVEKDNVFHSRLFAFDHQQSTSIVDFLPQAGWLRFCVRVSPFPSRKAAFLTKPESAEAAHAETGVSFLCSQLFF